MLQRSSRNTCAELFQRQRVSSFLYDVEKDELVAAHASGDNAPHFSELRIPRGQRLTGWVAANNQSILNSDPVLDLGESARQFTTSAAEVALVRH